ncbi:acyl-CoA dehydrogenase family protein [Pseudonocardia parietis]|uniref:Acyl-CoA dehydrogenase n=1 Tax=Pseudonocardia parietis TaxID=570936 RepID=A0ABS4VQP7_9PSEU|nr:acyl-CoA dehydrogenase family protein [Pseudonocardia parietis]MBP2366235.1 acyl-CoA dehydrogenase [Pseudonocardia parietis]
MKLVLDAEQEDLRAAVRKFLSDKAPSERVRAVMDGGPEQDLGHDPAVWSGLAALGVLGLTVPDELGGAGAGHVERAVVAEELGRALTPVPFLASAVLATDALLALDDDDARTELLPKLAAGELVGTVAVAERGGVWDRTGGATTATERDGRWQLTGVKTPVLAGDTADVVLVVARTPDGPGWFVVEGGAAGFARRRLTGLDPTRRVARLEFAATPARRLATADAAAAVDLVADLAAVALAAEQVGVQARAMELTVDYAKVRVQFGRPIGSYQAVKHGCADMYSAWEHAVSVLRYAAWTADEERAELPVAAALAQTYIGPAAFTTATGMVQYHGGVGYTWEHDAHLYYKRAKSAEQLLGSPAQHRARLADRLGV